MESVKEGGVIFFFFFFSWFIHKLFQRSVHISKLYTPTNIQRKKSKKLQNTDFCKKKSYEPAFSKYFSWNYAFWIYFYSVRYIFQKKMFNIN